MDKKQKKSKVFSELADSIAQIIKKPLNKDEIEKINSILKREESKNNQDEKPKVAKPLAPENNV